MSIGRRWWLTASGALGRVVLSTAVAAGAGTGAGYIGQDKYRNMTGYDAIANEAKLKEVELKLKAAQDKIKTSTLIKPKQIETGPGLAKKAWEKLVEAAERIKKGEVADVAAEVGAATVDGINRAGELSKQAISDLKQNIFDSELLQSMLYELYSTKRSIDIAAFALPFAFMFLFVYMGTRRLLDSIVEDPVQRARYMDAVNMMNEIAGRVNDMQKAMGLMQDGSIDPAIRDQAAADVVRLLSMTMPDFAQIITRGENR